MLTSKYIYDLPYCEREELCRILDSYGLWKRLGGLMGFTTFEIQCTEREERRNRSPSDELLTKWGHQNHTVQELFFLLHKMKLSQAMTILQPFVDEQYHNLIFKGKTMTELLQGSNDCSGGQPVDNLVSTPEHGDGFEKNLNVRLPDAHNLKKPGFSDTDKIQNIGGPVSIEANSAVPLSPGTPHSPPLLVPNTANAMLREPQLSPTGRATLVAGGGPNIAVGQQGTNLQASSSAQRKLSDVSIGTIPSEYVLPMLDFEELEVATNGWNTNNIIGRGGFGTVFKGIWKNTDVAIKRIELQKGDSRESQEVPYQQSQRELQVLQRIHHKNILQLYSFSLSGNQPCLVYQYMENGSLEDRLQCRGKTAPLSWSQRYNIAMGAARGLQFLHTVEKDKPLIHGDIKSANILLDANFEPRIGDFGLAREGPHTHYTHMKVSKVHGTRPYLPDEYLRSKTLSKKVDTFSFGVVLFELSTGLRAYDEKRTNRYLREEVLNHKNELELMDPKLRVEITISKRIEMTDHLSMLHSPNPKIRDGLLIFTRLMDAGKKCVSKLPKDRPEMAQVCQTLDQHASKAQVTPLELQDLYDKIWELHKQIGSSSQASTGQPVNSLNRFPTNLSSYPQSGLPVSGQPSPAISGNNPIRAGSQLNGPGNFSPLEQVAQVRQMSNLGTSNRPSGSNVSTNPYQSPHGDLNVSPKIDTSSSGVEPANLPSFDAPAIAVMPPTASDVSTISTRSYLSESSDYSSHDSQPTSSAFSRKLEDASDEQGPEILPLLTILGHHSQSEVEDSSYQNQSPGQPHDSSYPVFVSSLKSS